MDEFTIDAGAVRWAVEGAPVESEAALAALGDRPLLILMHGYGSHEEDLLALAPYLPPRFVCAAPRAPLPLDFPRAFAWAPITFSETGRAVADPDVEHFEGTPIHRASEALLAWLDDLDERVRAGSDRGEEASPDGLGTVALMGFSQGGCMATSLMRLRPRRFAAAVVCSGFVAPGRSELDLLLSEARPPLFWGRGTADAVIDEARIEAAANWLPRHAEVDARVYPGLGHSIGPEEISDVAAFLRAHVPEAS